MVKRGECHHPDNTARYRVVHTIHCRGNECQVVAVFLQVFFKCL